VDGPVSPVAAWHERCRRGELGYQVDADGTPVFPPRLGLSWRASAGVGEVHATTVVRPRGGEPYDVSLVALDEGFRMMSRVEGVAPEEVQVGMRVRVAWTDDDPPVPVFEPA
jgi:uncharacterized OB-fold protein